MRIGFKRSIRDLPFVILLCAIIIIPLLGYKAGENIKTPPFGFVCESQSDDGIRLCSELANAGFVRCETEETLINEIMAGRIDCGIVIDENIADRLAAYDTDGLIKLITSPETLMPELCRAEAVSALSLVYSPYITYDSLDGVVDINTVKDTYYTMVDTGALFGFDIETSEGTAPEDSTRSKNLFLGCFAIIVFITSFIAVARPVKKSYDGMKKRLGKWSAFARVLLPEFLIRTVMMLIAAFFSCLLIKGATTEILPAAVIYTILVNVAGLFVSMILPETPVIIITVFVSILSLGLCPVFTDLSQLLPIIGKIRYVLLPYYMWIL